MRIFLAGATGAIGRPLAELLIGAGHSVVGTTRSPAKVEALRAGGVEPVVVDVFDAPALVRAVAAARPELIMHQLTDLPPALDPARMAAAGERNARIRREGTRNLVDAALKAGVPRLVAQSIAWMYAGGTEPHREDDPLDSDPASPRAVSAAGVIALEQLTLSSPPVAGVVLRYGHLYGPATGFDRADAPAVHVDAAAHAALLAIEKARSGIYNIAERCGYLAIEKAERGLGFDPAFRLGTNAR
jgi:nucleoside-diphosphate-sugar epimerase